MKYLEIKEGFSILKDKIEAVERIDEFKSYVYTESNRYETTFPYITLLSIIEEENTEDKEDKMSQTLENFNGVLKQHQFFGG